MKSRWDSRNSVAMSKLQLQRAAENAQNYSLVSVDVTKYTGSSDRYQLPVEEIIPLIKVVENIGENVAPLISNNLIAERDQSSVAKLVDYRGIINQDFIKSGSEFEPFVNTLVDKIRAAVSLLP